MTPGMAIGSSAQRFQFEMADRLATFLAAFNVLGRLHVAIDTKAKTGKAVRLNTQSIPKFHIFDDAGIFGFESVPFTKAIERIRNLTSLTRVAFDGLKAQYKQQSFTVAGISDVSLIDKIQKALTAVLESGGAQSDFNKAVDQLTSDAGVEAISDAQLNTIFLTNFQTAYSNGRFEQMRDPDVTSALPFWKYYTVGDSHVRLAHAALDGFVARYDDAVWRKIYPPSGYNCRCTVTSIGPDDAPDDATAPGMGRLPEIVVQMVPDPGFGGRAFG